MKEALRFLSDLRKNNNRDWFNDHRDRYEDARAEVKGLSEQIQEQIMQFDLLDSDGTKIYRIYRDVRFFKDKTPFNVHWSMSFVRATAERRGGYYLKLTPGGSYLATGFWGPQPADLLHIRKQLSSDASPLREVINTPDFISYFGTIQGAKVKTSPKSFHLDDPEIDLIRLKQFILTHKISDREVKSKELPRLVADGFHKAMPFLDVMTEYLTTDLNGESLLS